MFLIFSHPSLLPLLVFFSVDEVLLLGSFSIECVGVVYIFGSNINAGVSNRSL